ncbi:MAG TPA: AMP-binding protein [Candidatus Eisenbacteria bacterium]|nr:AMP-binding protein [Candidatus Eisenbacteria bacterium]
MKSLSEMLASVTREFSSRTAVVESEKAIRYFELERNIHSLAGALHAGGIRPAASVAILLPNGAEFVTSAFALWSLGAVVVPLNDQYQENELARFLNEAGAEWIITARAFSGICERVSQLRETVTRIFLVDKLAAKDSGAVPENFAPARNPDAAALIQFSSGSTGRPKRIVRTHRKLLFELDSLARALAFSHEDRFIGVTPFSHVNGLMRSMLASLRSGATLYPLPKFDRHAVARAIETHGISIFIGVPFMFGVLAKSRFAERPDFSSLRLAISASAPMPPALSRQFYQNFGVYIRQLYGSTETGSISVNLSPDIEHTLDSVGHPLPGVAVEIYDAAGHRATNEAIGELAVRSPGAIEAYDGDERATQASFRDGYFLTGDIGRRDARGLIHLLGRKKLFINKGGYKINPREIEELIETHPKIEEAVVVGVPSAFGDERLKAILVSNAPCSEAEIIEHCRGKIADFKIPGLIEFRDSLPKSPTGKVRRELLQRVHG